MKRNTATRLGFFTLLSCSAILPVALTAQQASADPFIWLEDIDGQRSMDWVNAHNASTVAELSALPMYQSIYDRTKAILDSKDRIAYPRIVGDMLYNFWQDADHDQVTFSALASVSTSSTVTHFGLPDV